MPVQIFQGAPAPSQTEQMGQGLQIAAAFQGLMLNAKRSVLENQLLQTNNQLAQTQLEQSKVNLALQQKFGEPRMQAEITGLNTQIEAEKARTSYFDTQTKNEEAKFPGIKATSDLAVETLNMGKGVRAAERATALEVARENALKAGLGITQTQNQLDIINNSTEEDWVGRALAANPAGGKSYARMVAGPLADIVKSGAASLAAVTEQFNKQAIAQSQLDVVRTPESAVTSMLNKIATDENTPEEEAKRAAAILVTMRNQAINKQAGMMEDPATAASNLTQMQQDVGDLISAYQKRKNPSPKTTVASLGNPDTSSVKDTTPYDQIRQAATSTRNPVLNQRNQTTIDETGTLFDKLNTLKDTEDNNAYTTLGVKSSTAFRQLGSLYRIQSPDKVNYVLNVGTKEGAPSAAFRADPNNGFIHALSVQGKVPNKVVEETRGVINQMIGQGQWGRKEASAVILAVAAMAQNPALGYTEFKSRFSDNKAFDKGNWDWIEKIERQIAEYQQKH